MSGVACAQCGHGNREGRRFCAECGSPLVVSVAACPACGTANEPGERFCGQCGQAMDKPAPSAAPPTPSTPEHLAEKILRDRRALEGERKQVTVLFADVSGSMDLQAGLDPEEWAGIMQRFFEVLSDGVHRFEGTVDKFTGDGIMALFGAPVAHEDHARRACSAALHLVEAVSAYADDLRRAKGLSFSVRLGLNSGEVVVGGIGDDARMDYTALGHTVGLAQRMESLAEPGRAYLTEHTAGLVSRWFRLRDLGRFEVKGTPEPLGVFVLEAPRLRVGAITSPGGVSPLVGRAQEMAVLEGALARAAAGEARLVGVVGEAGVGKSRLCDEFAQACAARGHTVRRTAGLSHARAVAFIPILALLRDYFEITDADTARSAREKVAGRLLLLDAGFEEDLPLLFDFLEVPDPDRPPPRMGPDARMRRIFEVLRRVTARRSERETLVIVLEDLHWLDPQSAAFLEELVLLYPGTRTLVVANFRPEFQAAWLEQPSCDQLPLGPLSPEAVGELLGRLLGPAPSLAPLADHVMERTGGNPFFVEEMVRALIEEGTLEGIPGSYRLTRPLHEVKVPSTIQAVLAARIDRLPAREKRVLQTAAVIGRTFSEPVLRLVSGRPDDSDDVPGALRTLCAGEFLQHQGLHPLPEYRFWHPLTQEVAYGSLLNERRARLHGAVARAIVELEPDRLDERAALVASHFERAGEALDAARWHARAATRAVRSDLGEALQRWRASMALVAELPETEETLRLGVAARTRIIQIGARLGLPPDEVEALYAEGRARAERLGDVAALAGLIRFYTTPMLVRGEFRRALELMREAVGLADQTDDPALRASLWISPPVIYAFTGPLDEGLVEIDKATELCGDDPDRGAAHLGYSPLVRNLLSRALILVSMGRLDEARRDSDRALSLARRRSETELVIWTLSLYAHLELYSGEDRQALVAAGEAVRLAEDSGNAMLLAIALQGLGIAQLTAGQAAEAAGALRRAVDGARDHGGIRMEEAAALSHLARAHTAAGDHDAARRASDEAVTVSREQEAPVRECLALLSRAYVRRVIQEKTNTADREADIAAGLALVHEIGARTYEPFLHEELSRLTSDTGELHEALRLFTAMGAAGHARRLAAELGVSLPARTG